MPNFDAFFNPALNTQRFGITAAQRAGAAWQRIQDNPVTVAVWRGGSFDHNETVRLEWDNSTTPLGSTETTVAVMTRVIAFGIKNHATLTDTDISEGDELAYQGEIFQVKDVATPPGELQARCVRVT